MRILHLLSEKSWRGGEQQAAYLIESCQQANISSYVICRKDSAFHEYCLKHQLIHLALPFKNQFDVYTAWRIKHFCRQHKIQLIHLHTANAHGMGILSYYLGNHLPMVLSRRVIFALKDKWLTQLKYQHPAIKKIICVSNAVKSVLLNHHIFADRCVTIYDGIDLKKFNHKNPNFLRSRYRLEIDTFLVGNISALTAEKGLFTFIEAAQKVLAQGIKAKFFIIGEGILKAQLQMRIQELKLENDIFLTGFLHNIPEVLPELNCLVMTAEKEGLGSSLLDAMACHVPIVATASGGIPEIIVNEKTGLLAHVSNAAQISQQILRILTQPIFAKELTNNANNYLTSHFTRENMVAETLKIYQEILSLETPSN